MHMRVASRQKKAGITAAPDSRCCSVRFANGSFSLVVDKVRLDI